MIPKIKQLLHENLREELSNMESSLLPSSYQKIGGIVILNLKPELWKYDKRIGQILLKKIPNTRTVCRRTGTITSQYRKPQIKVIIGDKNTETLHKEHGVVYKLDTSKIMFAKGNLNERKRLVKVVRPRETIIDMFAGIGYFSIGIAKFSKPQRIYSIEINPETYRYLNENIRLNRVEDKVVPILGDCKEELIKFGRIADRIIMGLLPSPREYLNIAMKTIKNKGIIHYHSILRKRESYKKLLQEIEESAKKENFNVKLMICKKIKSYAPKVDHVVLDCKIIEKRLR